MSADPHILGLLTRYGYNSTSFQVLGPGFNYRFAEDGCTAYAAVPGGFVVAGEPFTSREGLPALTADFLAFAQKARRRCTFFAVERRFVDAIPLTYLQVGEQPTWDPHQWQRTVQNHRSLRQQLTRATSHHVVVQQVSSDDVGAVGPIRQALETLVQRWEQARPMAPMRFLVQLQPFDQVDRRRYFVARRTGDVVGLLVMTPVYAQHGWLFEHLLRDPRAPNGTAELLVDAAMRRVAAEGCHYVTLGLAPLSGRLGFWLRAARYGTAGLYNFSGLRAFKGKLRPTAWEPIYIGYPSGQSAWRSILDVLAAFASRSLIRFAVASFLRGPPLALAALVILLVPWTALLAAADTQSWFGVAWLQHFWVSFDVGMIGGLTALCRRWNHRLATLLMVLAGLDAVATCVQAMVISGPPGVLAGAVKVAAMMAPVLAATLLRNARRRHMGA